MNAARFPLAFVPLAFLLCAVGLPLGPDATALAQQPQGEAPFGDRVSQRITRYDRVSPTVGTAGRLGRLGVLEAKRTGFRAIVDLEPARDAAREERRMAQFSLLRYFNIPVHEDLPSRAQIEELARILRNKDNLPVLIHGDSGDEAAAIWALYRAAHGVPPEIAFEEGRAAGLSTRAGAVRRRLGLTGG